MDQAHAAALRASQGEIVMTATRSRPERFALRVAKGAFVPADTTTQSRLRARGYKTDDLIFAEFKKPRNPKFHRLAHQLGVLCAENLDAFDGWETHAILKRLQIEANVGCDEVACMLPGGSGNYIARIPRSLSYESMDDGEFHEVMRGMCRHIASTYWKGVDPQAIENMAGCMVEAA